MKFIDKTEIRVKGGRGGDGIACFMTAHNMPKLGPNGGNGGLGGNVYLCGRAGLNTLSTLRYRQSYEAADGGKGGSNNKTGRCGQDKKIDVPLGTVVFDQRSGQKVGEVLTAGDKLLIARGGKRGYGNLNFACATNRAPRKFTHGQEGEIKNIRLELKLLADVGLAGFPNAGKSTLLSRISAARPKIGDYPFTTLVPNLGVVEVEDKSYVVADIPGLIEGASSGRGLGLDFLKHLERTKIIAFILDLSSELDPLDQYQKLAKELNAFSGDLANKPRVVVLNKTDVLEEGSKDLEKWQKVFADLELKTLAISAYVGDGLAPLKNNLLFELDMIEKSMALDVPEQATIITKGSLCETN